MDMYRRGQSDWARARCRCHRRHSAPAAVAGTLAPWVRTYALAQQVEPVPH